MNKLKSFFTISFLLSILLTVSFTVNGCGKKDGNTTSGDKEKSGDNKSEVSDKLSTDSPIHVKFDISGTMSGTVDAYYHKTKSKSTSNMSIAGQKMSASAYFDGGDYVYIISEAAGMKTGLKYKKDEYDKQKKEGEFDAVTFKDQLKNMDKIGTETILDKQCDIYKSKDGKYQMSIYKEMVPLKFSTAEGKMVMVAKEFETDAKYSDDIFTPPADVNYVDAADMFNGMKDMKNMKDKMKNLDDKTKEMEDIMKKYSK
ncbi:MAG: hypothetical protein K8I03_09375 [Ignavibacteria bacterium]|nr:hypothetical protein [Ignavibacteria bacterium]